MKQDEELFNLSKAVYEATGFLDQYVFDRNNVVDINYVRYSSDYLLEKLYPLKKYNLQVYYSNVRFCWVALFKSYGSPCFADTPLKALLKLVLALKKAEEL